MLHAALFLAAVPGKGRGVFTEDRIPAGETVENSPVLVLNAAERLLLDQTLLHDYIFEWQPEGRNDCCVALGWLSMYNHASPSNCEYEMEYELQTMSVKTMRTIAAGEELTINYNGDWDNAQPVWFETL